MTTTDECPEMMNKRIDTVPGANGIVTRCIGRTPCAVKVLGKNKMANAEFFQKETCF
jgi:hypothetical protein